MREELEAKMKTMREGLERKLAEERAKLMDELEKK